MVTVNNFVKHIRYLIEKADLENAIKAMSLYFEDNNSQIYNKILLFSNQYHRIKEKNLQNLINDENYSKIVIGLSDILTELKKEFAEKQIPNDLLSEIKDAIQWNISIETEIEQPIQNNTPTLSQKESEDNELHQLVEVYTQLCNEVSTSSTQKEREERINVKRKLQEMLNKMELKTLVLPEMKGNHVFDIGNLIYKTETLDDTLIQDARKILFSENKYQWHEKSIIVSAISLSAILHPKFDLAKVELLLDALNAYQENIWEKALVGLVFTLNINAHRWHSKRSLLEKRLKELQQRTHIQDALATIEYILIFKNYEDVLFINNLFQHSFFKENPLHCFLPFYTGNELLKEALDNAAEDLDVTEYENYIFNTPLLDSVKYIQTFLVKRHKIQLKKVDTTQKEGQTYIEKIQTADNLNPYYNIIGEFYVFYQHYNHNSTEMLFKKELNISQSKISDIILERVTKLKAQVYAARKQKNYKSAALYLEQILNIEPKNHWALNLIADCFEEIGDYKKAMSYRKTIEREYINDYKNLYSMANILKNISNHNEALVYYDKVIVLKPNYMHNLVNKSACLAELKQYNEAIKLSIEIEKEAPKNIMNLLNKSVFYFYSKEYQTALKESLKALEIEPENKECLWNVALHYLDVNNFEQAIFFIEKAYKIDNKDEYILRALGRIYWATQKDLVQAKKYVSLALQKEKASITYGILGHIYLCQENKKEAITHYQKWVIAFGDIDDFQYDFSFDYRYMQGYGISEQLYKEIEEELVEYWKKNYKKGNSKGGFKKR